MSDEISPSRVIVKLFEAHHRFERFAMLYIRNRQQAQDIVMESFAYVWEHREELDSSRYIETYMLGIVKGKCIDYPAPAGEARRRSQYYYRRTVENEDEYSNSAGF